MRDESKAKIYSSVHYAHEPGLAAPDPYNHQWQAKAFKSVLDGARLPATVRLTRGRDIDAACGQLAAAALSATG